MPENVGAMGKTGNARNAWGFGVLGNVREQGASAESALTAPSEGRGREFESRRVRQ